jgi:hypothetical protein
LRRAAPVMAADLAGDGFAEALARFGSLYADQTEKDWKELCRSGKAGTNL